MLETRCAAINGVWVQAKVRLAQLIPQRQPRPVRGLGDLLLGREQRVGQQHRHLLIASLIIERQAQGNALILLVEPAVQLGATGPPQSGQFRLDPGELTDAQMKMPGTGVDRELAVVEPHLGCLLEGQLEDRAEQPGTEGDALPIFFEDLTHQLGHRLLGGIEIAVSG